MSVIDNSHPNRIATSTHIDPALPVFEGHYRDAPILPGVFTVDAVHQTALLHAASAGVASTLCEIKSARFTTPVFPGDDLHIDCTISVSATERSVTARCSSGRGKVAVVRLVYRDAS